MKSSEFKLEMNNFLMNFENSHFGNIKELENKNKYKILDLRNWMDNNLGFCFIKINFEKKDNQIERRELINELLNIIKNEELKNEEEIFKFYYFLDCLDLYYNEKEEIMETFFSSIDCKKIKKLFSMLIEKINNKNILPNVQSTNIFEIEKELSGEFWGHTIVNVLDNFYSKEFIFPEIYNLNPKYFVIYISNGFNKENFFIELKQSLNSQTDLEITYRSVLISYISDDKLNDNNKKIIKDFLKLYWDICGKYLFNKIMRNEFCVKKNINFASIFNEVIDFFMSKNNSHFLNKFIWPHDIAIISLFLNEYPSKYEIKIGEQLFNHFTNNIDSLLKYEITIWNTNAFFKLYDKTLLNTLLKILNRIIFLDTKKFDKWKELLKKLNNFFLNLYSSEEFEVILETNKIVTNFILLHIINENTEIKLTDEAQNNIISSLKIIQEELLFKYIEKSKKEIAISKKMLPSYNLYYTINECMHSIYSNEESRTFYKSFINKWFEYSDIKWEWMEIEISVI